MITMMETINKLYGTKTGYRYYDCDKAVLCIIRNKKSTLISLKIYISAEFSSEFSQS